VSTLPNPTPAGCQAGAYWRRCAGCDAPFPAAPGQLRCPGCHPPRPAAPCAVAHPHDRSPCQGPPDAVRVVDQVGDQRYGCVHHASVALASIEDARVYPGSVAGAAAHTFGRAQLRRPFAFDRVEPRPVPCERAGRGEW